MTVLILGNGLSRLAFHDAIMSFDGPVWGCNRIFLDYGEKLTGIAGHADVMDEAIKWRDEHGQKFERLEITCPEVYRKDTGTTLVAEALTRGMDVICCGFDLGGLDVYSPGHEKKNKTSWVTRWRLIFRNFDPNRVTFWGYDHKPFLLSSKRANEYFLKYSRGESHIPDDGYEKAHETWKNDYTKVWDNIPQVYLRNVGKLDWKFVESDQELKAGEKIVLPECIAKKYAESYKKHFVIEPLA